MVSFDLSFILVVFIKLLSDSTDDEFSFRLNYEMRDFCPDDICLDRDRNYFESKEQF